MLHGSWRQTLTSKLITPGVTALSALSPSRLTNGSRPDLAVALTNGEKADRYVTFDPLLKGKHRPLHRYDICFPSRHRIKQRKEHIKLT